MAKPRITPLSVKTTACGLRGSRLPKLYFFARSSGRVDRDTHRASTCDMRPAKSAHGLALRQLHPLVGVSELHITDGKASGQWEITPIDPTGDLPYPAQLV